MEPSRSTTSTRAGRRGLTAVALLATTLVTAALAGPAASAPRSDRFPGPVGQVTGADRPTVIPGSYLVLLKDSAVGGRAGGRQSTVSRLAADVTSRFGVRPDQVWSDALNGFSVRTSAAVARRLAAHPAVAHVEADQTVQLTSTQLNAPWNLDRIDAATGLDTTYSYQSQGSGVRAYVIDSGIRISHQDFGGQAYHGYDAIDGSLPAEDCLGHGTHAAATIGGTTYGVAKDVALIAVKVFGDCTGLPNGLAQLVSGVNWVTANHQAGQPAVASIGLSTPVSVSLNTAVANLVVDGVSVAVAAGNSGTDACNHSLPSLPTVVTVGASQKSRDARANSSNYGICLDLFAPGAQVTAAGHTSDTAVVTLSGTSQASSHVAGAAARVLSNNPAWSPAQVQSYLVSVANPVVVNPGPGSPNLLLHLSPLL